MKSILLFVCLFCFVNINCSAQLLKGYIITQDNDSLSGFIEEKRNSRKILSYKSTPESLAKSFSASKIKRFYIEEYDELYISDFVSIDQKPILTRFLEDNPDPKGYSDTVFLKQLVPGGLALLSYTDDTNRPHFYFSRAGKTEELKLFRYLSNSELVELEVYKQLLLNATSDCSEVNARTLSFNEARFIKFFKKYNECTSNIKYSSSKKRSMYLNIGVVAGASFAKAKYFGGELVTMGTPINYDDPSNNFLPSLGISLDLSSRKKSNPFALTIDALWRSSNFTASNNKKDPWFYSPLKVATVKMSWLTIAMKAKYKFNRQNEFRPYISAGLNATLLLNNNTQLVTSTDIPSETKTYTPLLAFRSVSYGLNASIGAEYKRFFIEAKYDQNLFPSREVSSNILIITPGIQIGYWFRKKSN